eukprot:g10949.t1
MDQVRATEGDLQVYRRAFAAADQGRELWQMWRNMVFAKKHWGGTSWPGWKFNRGTLVATPSVAVLSTIYSTGHDEVRGQTKAEWHATHPAAFVRRQLLSGRSRRDGGVDQRHFCGADANGACRFVPLRADSCWCNYIKDPPAKGCICGGSWEHSTPKVHPAWEGAEDSAHEVVQERRNGKNENLHGGLNRVVEGVARIGEKACDARVLQHVYRHNRDMDHKLGNTSMQSTRWPWRERSANEAARELLAALPFPKAPPDPEISTEELEPMGFEFHAAMKVAALEEARNAAARMVAERRGNNPHSSPSTTAGGATGAGASLLPTAGGRASAAAGTGPGPGALPPPTAGIRAGAAAAAAAAAGTGPGPGALPPPTAGTRAGAAAAAETGPGHH